MNSLCEKPVQIAHYFAERLGSPISYSRVLGLIYMADRLHMSNYTDNLSDFEYSVFDGKLSCTFFHTLVTRSPDQYFNAIFFPVGIQPESQIIFALNGMVRGVPGDLDDEAFDLLSVADLETLDSIVSKYGNLSAEDIDALVHDASIHPEIAATANNTLIDEALIYEALGDTPEAVQEQVKYRKEMRAMHKWLNKHLVEEIDSFTN